MSVDQCIFEPASATMCRCVRCHTYARSIGDGCQEGVGLCKRREGPSYARRAVNVIKATTEHVAAGMPICTIEEIGRRYAICEGCNLFLRKDATSGTCTHGGCGCNIVNATETSGRLNKAAWEEQKCPHPKGNKWRMTDAELQAIGHPEVQRKELSPCQ